MRLSAASLFLLSFGFVSIIKGDNATTPSTTYDFIIVGAGTAGCTVAARLCEAWPDKSIVLLEQGAPRTAEQELIVTAPRLAQSLYPPDGTVPGVTRMHLSEPNPALFDPESGMLGRVQAFVEFTTLGGTSNVAFQWEMPVNGSIENYGIDGLDTVTAASYFARIEEKVKPMRPPSQLLQQGTQDMLTAFGDSNFTILDQPAPFPPEQGDTVYVNQLTVDESGRRRSSYDAYLKDALEGPCQRNLHLIQDATVTKLLLQEEFTTGVEYMTLNDPSSTNRIQLTAREEVVVTAGPFGTPRLLQLSGIGPAAILADRGVEVVQDLPVGQKTYARPLGVAVGLYTGVPLDPVSNTSVYLSPEAQEQFLAGEGGPLGQAVSCTLGKLESGGYHGEGFVSLAGPDQPFVTLGCFANPKSSGNLTIVTSDPNTTLEFHTNLLSDPEDFAAVVGCVERLNGVLSTFPPEYLMTSFGPGETATADWVSATTGTSWHVAGGSAVGSVVDGSTFKVYGFENLRVVDASVLPVLSQSAGMLSSVYLVAEFFADNVIAEYAQEVDAINVPATSSSTMLANAVAHGERLFTLLLGCFLSML